jgi:leucyl/phenylalanyl-tRNA---protein transferase
MFYLTDAIVFPDVKMADDDGLLAIGGDLSTERLLLAYKNGIFPWYNEDEPICWWSPNPRFVLLPAELKVSKSMQTVLNNGSFRFTINKAFDKVITNCKSIKRKHEDGTWIQQEIIDAYTRLHQLGFAVSAEAWKNGELVGGLYGVLLGNVFFGESMFSTEQNIKLIDCQIYTAHLESLGARMMDRKLFCEILAKEV